MFRLVHVRLQADVIFRFGDLLEVVVDFLPELVDGVDCAVRSLDPQAGHRVEAASFSVDGVEGPVVDLVRPFRRHVRERDRPATIYLITQQPEVVGVPVLVIDADDIVIVGVLYSAVAAYTLEYA